MRIIYLDCYIAWVAIGTFIFVRTRMKVALIHTLYIGQNHTITLCEVVGAYRVIFGRIQLNWSLWFKFASHD
jgi:hypothetical protein